MLQPSSVFANLVQLFFQSPSILQRVLLVIAQGARNNHVLVSSANVYNNAPIWAGSSKMACSGWFAFNSMWIILFFLLVPQLNWARIALATSWLWSTPRWLTMLVWTACAPWPSWLLSVLYAKLFWWWSMVRVFSFHAPTPPFLFLSYDAHYIWITPCQTSRSLNPENCLQPRFKSSKLSATFLCQNGPNTYIGLLKIWDIYNFV